MRIYISGISGTGMGPLALMAKNAGIEVVGSDLVAGAVLPELEQNQIKCQIGPQDGTFLQKQIENGGVDWFVYTSALPADHPELVLAKKLGLKISKRDDLTAFLVERLNLKMVAVAGTHGKTTTTSMIVFAALKLNLPVAYLVGTTLGFAAAGAYQPEAKYFIYEADEYDRNFLKYHPWLAVIPFVSYDHADIYPTEDDYRAAFAQFESQSEHVLKPDPKQLVQPQDFALAGAVRRVDAALAAQAILAIAQDCGQEISKERVVAALNDFPGAGRRFERVSDGFYSDYAHHPEEIKATVQMAKEEAERLNKRGVVVVYQPHQNVRQHEIISQYRDVFDGAERVFWLPTYLVRENPELKILTPRDLIAKLDNPAVAEPAELNAELWQRLQKYQDEGYLVILMTAGPADGWFRERGVDDNRGGK